MTHELENLLRNEAERRRNYNPVNEWDAVTDEFYLRCLKTAESPEERRKRLYVIKGGKR